MSPMSPTSIPNFRAVCPQAHPWLIANRLFRSGSLVDLTHSQIRKVTQLGITAYVDLRGDDEVTSNGAPQQLRDAGIQWVHSPLGEYDRSSIVMGKPSPADYLASYLSMVSMCVPALVRILRTIGRLGERPLVIGCQTGKDRTGVVTALLLEVLGVPRSLVAQDYAASGPALRAELERLRRHWVRRGLTPQEYAERLETPPSVILELLAALDRGRDGVMGLLMRGGLRSEDVDALRVRLGRAPG